MKKLFSRRHWIQLASSILNNLHFSGLLHGKIYSGPTKALCVPGLNCYSCPAAVGACPIGALQAILTGNHHNFSFYVVGTLLLFGILLGRVICGFFCPFGWIQELLHKIPCRKREVPRKIDRPLRLFKYGVLLLFVLALPIFAVDAFQLGEPWFCKWICPAGTLEGGIPLLVANETLRSGVGLAFWWKLSLLLLTILFSMLVYRPFCRYVCPLGAFYSLFNRWSFAQLSFNAENCISCGNCATVCPMQVNLPQHRNSLECIRCGRCLSSCPSSALQFQIGIHKLGRESISSQKENAR